MAPIIDRKDEAMNTRQEAERLLRLAESRRLARPDGRSAAAARVLNLLDTADHYWDVAELEEKAGATEDVVGELQRRAVMCRIAAEFTAREIGEDHE
jgi:hypothetical protein